MHIGIDLAWNSRNRTGLAAVNDSGALVTSTSVRSDEEIDAWVAGLDGPVVNAAIDAPLIVTNATGMRECERLIGRTYGRYDASCHASNLGISYLNPPRAAVLAENHAWSTDPDHYASLAEPAAIEVYPHAAIVGLFRLGRILKYKSGALPARRAAFLELLDRMETLDVLALRTNRRWRDIRQLVDDAARPVDLDRVEDEVDAILCAYLAWLWHHDPAALHVYGDADAGYIIAPPAPTHPPSPRAAVAVPPPSSTDSSPPSGADLVTGLPAPDSTPGTAPEPALVNVTGRPTGYGGSGNEARWKDAVRSALEPYGFPAPTRLRVDFEFRLAADQRGHNAPDLDNLLKSTIDAFDGLLGRRPIQGRPQADDERIDRIGASKRYAQHGEVPGATIVIRALPDER